MTAPIELSPIEELGVDVLGPAPRWEQVMREDTHAHRKLNLTGVVGKRSVMAAYC